MPHTVITVINEVIFYLTPERVATDIPDRAMEFTTAAEADAEAGLQNISPEWSAWGIRWNSNLEVFP